MRRRRVPEGIRPTKVGIWFVCLCLLVGVAATNTGNNALYMVLALMLATLVVSGVLSRNNVRGVEVEVTAPEEIFAGTPAGFQLHLHNTGLTSRWLLLVSVTGQSEPLLCSYLPRRARRTVLTDVIFPRRGPQRIEAVHLATLFPLGLFRKGMRLRLELEVLVFPAVRPGSGSALARASAPLGPQPARRRGWGHELHSLRAMRPGDDPRRIHWKQTARTGRLIFMERQAERRRQVSVVVDNALDPSEGLAALEGLERRISEGASAALEYLNAGFEVELITRSARVPFAGGARQRRRVLEALARLEPAPPSSDPIARGDATEIRFDAAHAGAVR